MGGSPEGALANGIWMSPDRVYAERASCGRVYGLRRALFAKPWKEEEKKTAKWSRGMFGLERCSEARVRYQNKKSQNGFFKEGQRAKWVAGVGCLTVPNKPRRGEEA